MAGWIYVLSNPAMPGMVKIGFTETTPDQRALELHSTGVPAPFAIEYVAKHPAPQRLEAAVHKELAEFRVMTGREFFHVPPRVAVAVIDRLKDGAAFEERVAAAAARPLAILSTSQELGEAVRHARHQRAWTQTELAVAAGTGRRAVVEIESGKQTLQMNIVLAVCGAVGLVLAIGEAAEAA